jgi:hypothetical protein
MRTYVKPLRICSDCFFFVTTGGQNDVYVMKPEMVALISKAFRDFGGIVQGVPRPCMPSAVPCECCRRVDVGSTRYEAHVNNEYHTNKAVKTRDGWIYFDQNGKDFGPYETEDMAITVGTEAAKKEERILRGAFEE